MARNLLQCVIQKYTGPRIFDALQIPHGYVIKNVRLPHSISIQIKPLEKSIVFVAQTDDFQAYFVSMIRDPIGFLEKSAIGVQGSVNDPDRDRSETQFDQGELYLEARGESKDISGAGGTIYLANDGTVNLHSGRRKESIIIGGTDDEDDGEIVITSDNGFFESNVNEITQVRSTIRFDEDNLMKIGNFRVLVPDVGLEDDITDVPIVNLVMEPDGELTIGNFNLAGLSLNELNMTPLGNTSLTTYNLLGTEMNKLEMSPLGTTTLDANIINLNSGIRGAARLTDTIFSSKVQDAAFWTWMYGLKAAIDAIVVVPLDGGAALKTGLAAVFGPTGGLPLFTPIPTSLTGKITSASNSVLVGD